MENVYVFDFAIGDYTHAANIHEINSAVCVINKKCTSTVVVESSINLADGTA